MKIRSGFVSNSSSSSFIVAAKPNKTKVKVEFEIDLMNFLDEKPIENVETLVKFFKDEYSYSESEMKRNSAFQEAKKAIENGQAVFMGSFSDQSDSNIERFLCQQGFPKNTKNITIIQNSAGY